MYTKEEILKKLKQYDDDTNFKFDDPSHTYTYRDAIFTSVTTFISTFYKEFDRDGMSKKKAKELGVTQEELLKEWDGKGDVAKVLGTAVHLWIENYYNNILQSIPTDVEVVNRINKFNVLHSKHLHKLQSIKCEQMIFSKDKLIAGMIDSLFLYKGNVFIIDWKTNKKMTSDKETKYKKMLFPFNDYWENKFNLYSIQQSLYALILEEIGINVKSMYLGYIGPDNPGKLMKCVDMRTRLKKYFTTKENNKNINEEDSEFMGMIL